jgi:hypothetical protein
MKLKFRPVLIFVLVAVIFWLVLTPRTSGADSTLPAAQTMPSGAMMPKAPEEDCTQKYGSNWKNFSPALCQKG